MSAGADETTALLIRARSFIERGWCKGAAARDVSGATVQSSADGAVFWCVAGAIHRAGKDLSEAVVIDAFDRFESAIDEGAAHFNDTQKTVEAVLAAFDRAIAAGGAIRSASLVADEVADQGETR